MQLKRSSASRSVNLQTNRTKTWQFKFTRNQGFTQDLNSEEMRRQWRAADNAPTMRRMRQTARQRHRGRDQIPGKEPRRAIWPGTIQTRVLLRQGSFSRLALYKFCFQQCHKEERLNGKTILGKFWIVSCNLLVAFEVLKSILLMLNVILWSQIYPLHPSDTQHFCKYLHWICKNSWRPWGWNADILSRRRTDADAVGLGLWIMKPRAAI